jgi:PAS domain S-box-containing protein
MPAVPPTSIPPTHAQELVASESLHHSEERFRLLVSHVSDYAIFMLEPNGFVSTWNLGASRIKGYSADEIIGKHFSNFYRPEDRWKCEVELATAIREGRVEDEGWRVRKDGSVFWANVVITALRDRTGELIGFAKVTRDLTEHRRSQVELARSEERLRLMIESVKDYAIFMLDPSGNVATWNVGAQRINGYGADEIIGQHFSKFYPAEDIRAGKCERELREATAVGRFEDEDWRVRKDGSIFWANVIISPIRDADGSLQGFTKVTRDLSERKRHEEERISLARAEEARKVAEENEDRAQALIDELRRARDKAEQATRLKDEFLATVSHELRTPLSAMLGWARLLQSEDLPPDTAKRAIDTIVRNAVAQNKLIDDLLDVSRIIAGQLRLDVDFVDANQVLNAALDAIKPAADAKSITVQSLLDPDAGAIKGDAARLQQVFWNLLSNAVKFTPRRGRIHVTLQRQDSNVQIEVADNGQGIASEFLPRVFDRFSQQDSTNTRRTGGLGLGLAIVKHLTELHGGTVEAHSDGEGSGATFVIRLPLVPVRVSREPASSSVSVENFSFPSELAGLRVLVLDDEEDARELVESVLKQAGATVVLAASVSDALAAVREHQPDVIVSDIGMPDEDGYSFIRKLRSLSREKGGRIPALALTAYARADDRRKALAAGYQNHAAKPIEPQELMLVIANLAGRFA